MVRRLANPANARRHAPPESLRQQISGGKARTENEKGGKGSHAPYETAEAIARTWAKAGKPGDHLNIAATALAEELQGMKGRIPGALVAAIPARWAKLAHATQHHRIKMLRRVCRDIDQTCRTNLAEALPHMKPPEARMQTAPPGTLTKLLAIAPPHLQLFIRLCAGNALRFSEAWSLEADNWNPEKKEIRNQIKGGGWRAWQVDDATAALLDAACASPARPANLISRLYGGYVSRQALRRHFYKLLALAGVDTRIRPHDLRRTAAVELYRETKDVLAVKKLLKHDTIKATAHYLKPYEPETMRAILREERAWTPRAPWKGELPN